MNEYIKKYDAIEAVRGLSVLVDDEDFSYFEDRIKALPSAYVVERKRGKWIEIDDGWDGVYYECSCCKEPFVLIDGTPADNQYNFCPNCGSDNRKGEDDD